jgi:exodeoxyribonuclease V alpha subunit
VCAPTGKAAVRFKHFLELAGRKLDVGTIHRTLLHAAQKTNGEIDKRWLEMEELSMGDTDMVAALLGAARPDAHVLIVGDRYQLPPIGHGAPLRDMIAAGVPTAELTVIRRNSGSLVEACRDVKDGLRYSPVEFNLPMGNIVHLEAATSDRAADRLFEVLKKIGDYGFDRRDDVQILVAVNEKSRLGRARLNQELQQYLNPDGEGMPGNPFRLGDKAICLRNQNVLANMLVGDGGEEVLADESMVYFANGEQGVVVGASESHAVLEFDYPRRRVRVPVKKSAGDEDDGGDRRSRSGDWDLAYALTCHKLQGSQSPVVVVILDDYYGAQRIHCREWFYTALSRAQKLCITIGKKSVADEMIKRRKIAVRRTFLQRLLEEYREAQASKRRGAE